MNKKMKEKAELIAEVYRVKWHCGNSFNFLERHQTVCRKMADFNDDGVRSAITDMLFDLATDERSLWLAWKHVLETSGETAGVDGMKCSDIPSDELWQWLRGLRDHLRRGEYEHLETVNHWKAKKGGRGRRLIQIPTVYDRVVQRSIQQILEPYLGTVFVEWSIGYRDSISRLDGLALLEPFVQAGRSVLQTEDIQDAFGSVPQRRMLNVVKKYLPEAKLNRLIEAVVNTRERRGLRQGGSLSPLLLNLYLHHNLDLKWQMNPKLPPMIRYVDDIMLVCRSSEEALFAAKALTSILRPAGFAMNPSGICADVDSGIPAKLNWLGFEIAGFNRNHGALLVKIGTGAYEKLRDRLSDVVGGQSQKSSKVSILRGWVFQQGPAFISENHTGMLAAIENTFNDINMSTAVDRKTILRWWEDAADNFEKIKIRYMQFGDLV